MADSKSTRKLARRLDAAIPLAGWLCGGLLIAWGGYSLISNTHDPDQVSVRNTIGDLFFLSIPLLIGVFITAKVLGAQAKSLEQQEKGQRATDQQERARRERQDQEIAQAERNRQYALQSLASAHQSAVQLQQSIPSLLRGADANLNLAQQEFQRGAFSPFWAAIEQATMRLGELAENLQQFDSLVSQHKELSSQLASGFGQPSSPFPVRLRDIYVAENGQKMSQRMDSLVGRAQTNYQFATIFEQRRTSSILIAGFQNLGSAISGMTSRITSQLMDVVNAIDTVSSTASGHSKEALEMLDNIQNRHLPMGASFLRNY